MEHTFGKLSSVGVTEGVTVTGVKLEVAHCPALGVKVRLNVPGPAAIGLNKFGLDMPVPVHVPVKPPCDNGRLIEAAETQILAIGSRLT